MITSIILPQLGDTMNEGTITRWFKREGDAVKKGEPLFEVLTDKANIEVEATVSGYLRRVLYPENASVPTGHTIAYLTTTADEPLTVEKNEAETKGGSGAKAATETTTPDAPLPVVQAEPPRKRQFISPRARRLAQEFGVDVTQLTASSKSGRIMEADVRNFLAARAPAPTPIAAAMPVAAPLPIAEAIPPAPAPTTNGADTVVPVAGVRKIIFDRMGASTREIARVTLTTEADATRLVELREEINAQQSDTRFSFTDFLVLLTARALLQYPYMNATLRDDGVHQHSFVNMGVAADTERGLLVPVVRDAHRKSLGEIYAELRRLSEGARTGKISPDDLRGATFTITNLGQYEIDGFTPIVNQPETAILGVGRIAQKPAAYQGQLALRWMVSLSLSFDHRIVDGAPAARFLQHMKRLVTSPGLVLV
ncbi:MAG TPA: dihydrolipoamide acetyltransferase family protein [Anaerolineae bacterium]|nr:dihydrolipoamide acetyltransferase family protein [Anaerolineae bacterium]